MPSSFWPLIGAEVASKKVSLIEKVEPGPLRQLRSLIASAKGNPGVGVGVSVATTGFVGVKVGINTGVVKGTSDGAASFVGANVFVTNDCGACVEITSVSGAVQALNNNQNNAMMRNCFTEIPSLQNILPHKSD